MLFRSIPGTVSVCKRCADLEGIVEDERQATGDDTSLYDLMSRMGMK